MKDNFKAVVFSVGKEEYAFHINQVVSIERMQPITTVPEMSKFVVGAISLRGSIIPVIDLCQILLGKAAKNGDATRIIVANSEGQSVGLIVDAATDVLDIPDEWIQDVGAFQRKDSFLLGIAKLQERLLILLDIPKLFQSVIGMDELSRIRSALV